MLHAHLSNPTLVCSYEIPNIDLILGNIRDIMLPRKE